MLYKHFLNADPRWRMQRRWTLLCQAMLSLMGVLCLGLFLQLGLLNSLLPRDIFLSNELVPGSSRENSRSFKNFSFIINNDDICDVDDLYFIIIIHSKPDHFLQRDIIRNTWGSIRRLQRWNVKLAFLLGKVSNDSTENSPNLPLFSNPQYNFIISKIFYNNKIRRKVDIQDLINKENLLHHDIIQGDFLDTYHNLTYKHMMAYKWLLQYCPSARYVLKTDDDAWIDMKQLWSYLERTFPSYESPPRALICYVVPSGTQPQRRGKWEVSLSEYPWRGYPTYCGGLAYIASPKVINDLYEVSKFSKFLWVDDVFATGLLPNFLNDTVRHHYLNLRYDFSDKQFIKWVRSGSTRNSSPYLIVHTDITDPSWPIDMIHAWEKTQKLDKLNL